MKWNRKAMALVVADIIFIGTQVPMHVAAFTNELLSCVLFCTMLVAFGTIIWGIVALNGHRYLRILSAFLAGGYIILFCFFLVRYLTHVDP
jgi:hypothetical protein